MVRRSSLVVVTTLLVALAACNNPKASSSTSSEPSTATQPAAQATEEAPSGGSEIGVAEAKTIFASRCATCHGKEGKGDGPGAVALNPKPRNYHDKDWQAKVTDDEIKKAIVYGGAAVGKSAAMPGNPDLDSKPAVVEALVRTVRAYGKD